MLKTINIVKIMKKTTIILASIIILAAIAVAVPKILYLAYTIPNGNCGDTDANPDLNTQFQNQGSVAGIFQGDFYQNGTNQTVSGVFTDYCESPQTLIEFSCGSSFSNQYSNLAGTLRFDCSELGNYSCVQGSCENVPAGSDWSILGEWHFSEGVGNITNDSSGNGLSGTLMNGTNWTQGIQGNAIEFDGYNGIILINDQINLNTNLEIDAKIKRVPNPNNPNGPNAQNTGTIIRQVGSFHLGIIDNQISISIKLCSYQYPGCGSLNQNWVTMQGPTLSQNQWYDIKLRKNETSLSLYIDGALVNSQSSSNTLIGSGTGPLLSIGKGYPDPGNPYSASNTFSGIIDEVSIRGY